MMAHILVDTNVLLDVIDKDPNWFDWSSATIERYCVGNILAINQVI